MIIKYIIHVARISKNLSVYPTVNDNILKGFAQILIDRQETT